MTNGQPSKATKNKEPKEKDRLEGIYKYAQTNPRDMIAYVLMVFGIILLFFQHLYGGLIIGIVFGIYFSKEIGYLIRHYEDFIEEQGLVRSLILAGVLLAFFIAAPGIYIGAAIVVALRHVLVTDKDK